MALATDLRVRRRPAFIRHPAPPCTRAPFLELDVVFPSSGDRRDLACCDPRNSPAATCAPRPAAPCAVLASSHEPLSLPVPPRAQLAGERSPTPLLPQAGLVTACRSAYPRLPR
jgi:hypothetical protein